MKRRNRNLAGIIGNDFSEIKPPDVLNAELRPYQLAGFQWLVFLKEAGWGGILADDMGLGKTVQALQLVPLPLQNIKSILKKTRHWNEDSRKFWSKNQTQKTLYQF